MKLYVLPPSPRAFKVIALKNHLGIECEIELVDLSKGDQLAPRYIAMNPNRKMPVLEDDGFVLWESNAILFYLASKTPHSRLWPGDPKNQADVLRWLAWESAHFDAESCGMVGFEKISKGVLGLGTADPAFIARGEENFARFAAVLNDSSKGPQVAQRRRANDRRLLDRRVGAGRRALTASGRRIPRDRTLVRRARISASLACIDGVMMKPRIWLRIAAGLQAFGTLGHNLATLNPQPTHGAPEQAVFDAMRGFQFDIMGSTRSTWDFYRGYQFSTTVTFVLTMVLLWLLSNTSSRAPREAKPLVLALLLA